MKRFLICATIAFFIPMMMNSQTYSSLWKQVRDAENNDLPQTEQEVLRQIAAKAKGENDYGQLLKAELQHMRSQFNVSTDSLAPEVERLKQREQETAGDVPLQAVYQTVLGYLYKNYRSLDEDRYQDIAREYFDKALAQPAKLAAVKATDYEPFVMKGQDSRYYGDDLLSLIGYEAGRFDVLRDYYLKAGDRRATLLASERLLAQEEPTEVEPLNKSRHIQRLDSLIAEYQDLVECGEVAISRYVFMDELTDATTEQKWQYINTALERWGAWPRMNELRNKQRQLTNPLFTATSENSVNIPHKESTVKLVELRGIAEITLRLYSVKVNGDTDLNPRGSEDYKKIKPLLTPLPNYTQTRKYVGKRPYELYEDSLTLPALPVGVYMLEIESQPNTQTSRQLYYVSDVRVITIPLPSPDAGKSPSGKEEDLLRIVVVNATSGQPIKGATVKVSYGWGKNRKTDTLSSDEQGECFFTRKEYSNSIRAYTADDKACPYTDERGNFYYNDSRHDSDITDIYTDRAIYRPGQTVHAAAIFYYTRNGRDYQAQEGMEMLMQLRDANYKVVGEQRVTTDKFGTCATQFTLPAQGLTGQFSIHANGETHYFRVEEYKRPAFEVDIPRVASNYEDGDTVVARGTARSYAGVPVQGATVKYQVVRRRAFWWMSYSSYWDSGYTGSALSDEVMAKGETTTDDKGQFTVDMPMVLPKTKHPMFYNFVLTADVTDQAGETHQGVLSLPLGNRKTAFSVTIPEKVLNEGETKMAFHQQNAAGVDLEAKVRYRFESLPPTPSKKEGGTAVTKWTTVNTNTLVTLPKLPSGRYRLVASPLPLEGEEEALTQEFVVFSLDDKRPATDTRDWFYVSHEQFPWSGDPVTVQAGSSDKDVHIVYSIISGNKVLENGSADRSNELINRKLTYLEKEYGNGILLNYAWMKDGRVYTHSATIRRPMPDMHLDMKWTTFRNRLVPGQQEEWTLCVTKPDGSPAPAQLMATLYDKSLDQLAQHNWYLSPNAWLSLPSTRWESSAWGSLVLRGMKIQQGLSVPTLNYNHIDYDVFPSYSFRFHRMYSSRMLAKSANGAVDSMPLAMVEESVAMDRAEPEMAAESKRVTGAGLETGEQEAKPQIRENLQETAFFYPQMVCDSTGHVSLKFTLPESLTTWRFLAVAHTEDMMYGQLSDEAVAKKDVMIQPNMPRFIREGDQGTISARIINTSDQTLSGTAMLQLLDPETERVVLEQKQQVSLKDSSTVGVTFHVAPSQITPPHSSLLIARVSIVTPKHSDGEQHYLPILPNTERVTVTVPFTQTAPGTKQIDLGELVPVSDPQTKLTVEYTNNPAWLMIQALPDVGHPHDDCAVCQAVSFYANSIGRHILKQNPTAKHIFEQWKQEEANAPISTLNSQLEKDQELKDLLLNETPWVIDADNETEQRHRLADFFDQSLMDARLASALEKMKKLQNGDGSWSWWPGMRGSVYMTTEVTELLVRLNEMTGQQDETKKMLSKAFGFLGEDIVELVKEMKKEEKKGIKQFFPSHRALEWLYLCAIDGRKLPDNVDEANTYLKNLLKKEVKSQTILEKALSAIVLDNKTYIKSLKEYTVYKEDMGRYYDTQRASYSWRDYKIPTQVAAIEALKRMTPQDTVTITEMQRWLLQQKRTQAWDTPINSADAIYAFLNGNSQALAPQPKTVLAIDGKAIDTSDATAGIGYVKTAQHYNGEKTFTAEKTSTGTSWGAVYAQFTQPARDIKDQASGLTVKRELLTAEANSTPYTLHSTLKVGDRVKVRITIEAERDYDFVQLQDKRAACMEPVEQLSGYNWRGGYYCTPKDHSTSYFFDMLRKGRHVIETEYYIDREGTYETGSCTVQCAYAPEFRATTKATKIEVKNDK